MTTPATVNPATQTGHAEPAAGLRTAVQIEVRKLLSTRGWLVISLLAVALAVLIAVLTVAASKPSSHTALDVFSGALVGSVQTAYLLSAVVGIISIAGEYRHRTVTATYLAVPHRGTVITAKLLVLFGYGIALGVVVMSVCTAIVAPWLAQRGYLHGDLAASGVARTLIGGTAAIAIVTILGVGLGALVRSQIAAIVGLAIYLFALEPTINNITATRGAYPYLPGGSVQALAYTGHTAFGSTTGATLLNPWIGGVLLAAYGLGLTAIAVRTSIRRDIA